MARSYAGNVSINGSSVSVYDGDDNTGDPAFRMVAIKNTDSANAVEVTINGVHNASDGTLSWVRLEAGDLVYFRSRGGIKAITGRQVGGNTVAINWMAIDRD